MQTRSQTKSLQEQKGQPIYEVNIDFDDASECWRANKCHICNGQYKYICDIEIAKGKLCGNLCSKKLSTCWNHRKHNNKLYM
jgi:hypothetical protein